LLAKQRGARSAIRQEPARLDSSFYEHSRISDVLAAGYGSAIFVWVESGRSISKHLGDFSLRTFFFGQFLSWHSSSMGEV
jgi:hypothetical protein